MLSPNRALSWWAGEILDVLDAESRLKGDGASDVIPTVAGFLGSWFETDAAYAGDHENIASRVGMSVDAVDEAVAWLLSRGFLDRETKGALGWLYTPTFEVELVDGPLHGMTARVALATPARVLVNGAAVYEYDLAKNALRFAWPMIGAVVFRGGPVAGRWESAHTIPPVLLELESVGHEGEGIYRRNADGHFDWFEKLPETFDHDEFERQFAEYAKCD